MALGIKAGLAILAWWAVVVTVNAEGINIPIHRRGGRLSRHEHANLSRLAQALLDTEARYARSYGDVEHNGLVRKWHQMDPIIDDVSMYDGMGREGSWYASITVGSLLQNLEFQLDMLHPDFFTLMTTSGRGQRYNTTKSETHGKNLTLPTCLGRSDAS